MTSSTFSSEARLRAGLRLAALAALVASAFCFHRPSILELVERSRDNGDLYALAPIADFRCEIPPYEPERQIEPVPKGEPVWVVGDSFSEKLRRGIACFPEQLSRRLGVPVLHVDARSNPRYFNPMAFVADHGRAPKVILFQLVERYLEKYLGQPFDLHPERPARGGALRQWMLRPHTEELEGRYRLLLKSLPISESVHTALYRWFGSLPEETPLASTKPPMLFFHEDVESFYARHDRDLLDRMAMNVAVLAGALRRAYGARLVMMPVPNKLTVYRELVTGDRYDDFLPRFHEALARRGVDSIRLYERFRRSSELLYFPSDTHWNQRGIDVALDAAQAGLTTSQ